jgi:hypothetical protein
MELGLIKNKTIQKISLNSKKNFIIKVSKKDLYSFIKISLKDRNIFKLVLEDENSNYEDCDKIKKIIEKNITKTLSLSSIL